MNRSPSVPMEVDGSKNRKITVKVPESYKKVDESVWEELEKYLFVGFLTSSAVVSGKSFVFKTLNHHEIRNIGFLKPMKSSPVEARSIFRSAFIAHSIFIVDGVNALYDRPKHISRLIKIISKIPQPEQEKIIENLGALNQKAQRLYPLAEIYVHENRSRYNWLHSQSGPVHSPIATGVPGTEELGMNHCQQTWTAVNRLLDKKEEAERDWSNSKFVGSCFNGKGVRSIDEKDRGRREKERTDIEDRKMKVLYAFLNRLGTDEGPPMQYQLQDGRMATVVQGNANDGKFRAESAEELAEQLSAALSGEKDHHDLVIEAHEKKLREKARLIDDYKRQIYTIPTIPQLGNKEDGYQGVRILGGKKEADQYLARMEAMKREHHAKLNRQVRMDLSEGSDKTEE